MTIKKLISDSGKLYTYDEDTNTLSVDKGVFDAIDVYGSNMYYNDNNTSTEKYDKFKSDMELVYNVKYGNGDASLVPLVLFKVDEWLGGINLNEIEATMASIFERKK